MIVVRAIFSLAASAYIILVGCFVSFCVFSVLEFELERLLGWVASHLHRTGSVPARAPTSVTDDDSPLPAFRAHLERIDRAVEAAKIRVVMGGRYGEGRDAEAAAWILQQAGMEKEVER